MAERMLKWRHLVASECSPRLTPNRLGLGCTPMAKVPTLIFSLVAVFSFLIWGRAEDTSAALRRAQALEKAGQSRESIPIYLDVLHSDPQCLEADVGLGRSYFAIGEYAKAVASFEKA